MTALRNVLARYRSPPVGRVFILALALGIAGIALITWGWR